MTDRKTKILLVEDDLFMIDLLVRVFSDAGFETIVAKTSAEGMEKFRSAPPDLIVLDILLPDQNGFELLRQIRREPNGPETKVVVLSNLSEGKDMDEAKRLGALDYMVKANLPLPEIVDRVRAALGQKS